MKNLISMKKLILTISVFCLFSCETESERSNLNESNVTSAQKIALNNSANAKKVIFYASWDEWGRASKGCDGWGLCNFQSCWFCEPLAKNVGTVEVDATTLDGYLYIALDPSDATQAAAIKARETFYVDQDINNPNATVYKGAYSFDPAIGNYGGYQLNITVKDTKK